MTLNKNLFTDFVIVLNASASLVSLLSVEVVLTIMFALNACIMFQYRVEEEKR